jgi:hypothetical protein
MRSMHIALTVALCAALACAAHAADTPTAPQAAGWLRAAAAEVKDLKLKGDVALYTRDDLRKYIDGDADRHFAYHFQWTASSTWVPAAGGSTVAADVYCYATSLDAFGAFSQDRDASLPAELVAIPGQTTLSAYWAANQLHLWRGPLYLRVIPATFKDTAKPTVLALAAAVAAQLPAAGPDPALFKLPPTRDLIIESVKFQRANVLGRAELSDALLATYGRRKPDRTLQATAQMYLFDTAGADAAQDTYGRLLKVVSAGQAPTPVAALGDAAVSGRDRRLGQYYLVRQGPCVTLLTQITSATDAEALLRELGRNIRARG